MKEGSTDPAILRFNSALKTDPTCVDALVARGALLANQGQYKRALQDFEEGLQIDRHHVNALKYLHDVLISMATESVVSNAFAGFQKEETCHSHLERIVTKMPFIIWRKL